MKLLLFLVVKTIVSLSRLEIKDRNQNEFIHSAEAESKSKQKLQRNCRRNTKESLFFGMELIFTQQWIEMDLLLV